MKIEKLHEFIENLLPKDTAIDGDRIGLQIQAGRTEIRKLLITMELNDEVILEAKNKNCDCIITFHPLIYKPLAQILDNERVGRITTKLILSQIALFSVHTTFDAYFKGTSRILSDKLGLVFESFLIPDETISNSGIGLVAKSINPIKPDELLETLYNITNSPSRFCYGKPGKLIERIAIIGGSGSSLINNVFESEVDAFITADISYHTFHMAAGEMMMIDPGHYEMEQFVPYGLMNLLKENSMNMDIDEIIISEILTNPVSYFPDGENYKIKQKKYLSNNFKAVE